MTSRHCTCHNLNLVNDVSNVDVILIEFIYLQQTSKLGGIRDFLSPPNNRKPGQKRKDVRFSFLGQFEFLSISSFWRLFNYDIRETVGSKKQMNHFDIRNRLPFVSNHHRIPKVCQRERRHIHYCIEKQFNFLKWTQIGMYGPVFMPWN